jgi:hypothetical protein
MARTRLKPAVSAQVDKLLRENPISVAESRYCKDRPADIMADVSTWADDERNVDPTTFSWHFVDIPISATRPPGSGYSVAPWCHADPGKGRPGAECITEAIELEWKILMDKTRPAAERARALRFLIHLVGDTQQPLHDSDNRDQGGNCTVMHFFDEERPTNLHSIWDTKLLDHDLALRKLDKPAYAAALSAEFASRRKVWSHEKIDPERWAWQGQEIAVKITYGLVSPAIPVEQPGPDFCDTERDRIGALKITLGESYFESSMPVVREQLARSAARLANLLNHSF